LLCSSAFAERRLGELRKRRRGISDAAKKLQEKAKGVWKNVKEAFAAGFTKLKTAFSKGAKAGCGSAQELYDMICPDEQKTADAYKKFFDQPRGPGLDDATAKQNLTNWWAAKRDGIKADIRAKYTTFLTTLYPNATERKTVNDHISAFMVGDDLDEATLVGFGFVNLAYAEINAAANMGSPEYLTFSVAHENGHMLDPKVMTDPPLNPLLTPKYPNRNSMATAPLLNSNGKDREIFADYSAASALSDFTKEQMLSALSPFCGGGADANYPPMKDRILMIARHPQWYPKICGATAGARGTTGTDWFNFP